MESSSRLVSVADRDRPNEISLKLNKDLLESTACGIRLLINHLFLITRTRPCKPIPCTLQTTVTALSLVHV